jgi:hypothetical protein
MPLPVPGSPLAQAAPTTPCVSGQTAVAACCPGHPAASGQPCRDFVFITVGHQTGRAQGRTKELPSHLPVALSNFYSWNTCWQHAARMNQRPPLFDLLRSLRKKLSMPKAAPPFQAVLSQGPCMASTRKGPCPEPRLLQTQRLACLADRLWGTSLAALLPPDPPPRLNFTVDPGVARCCRSPLRPADWGFFKMPLSWVAGVL